MIASVVSRRLAVVTGLCRYLTVMPSIDLSLPVSVDTAAAPDHHGNIASSHDELTRTFFNQSSLLTIILSRLVGSLAVCLL